MKIALALVALSVAVLALMIFQAVRQELHLRGMKNRLMEDTAEVKRKEEAIAQVKKKIQKLKLALVSVNKKLEELNTVKAATKKTAQDLATNIGACNTDKGNHEKKKIELTQAIATLTSEHEASKKKIEEETQLLKQQILDRDKAICAFVDPTKPEGLRLCGMSEAKN